MAMPVRIRPLRSAPTSESVTLRGPITTAMMLRSVTAVGLGCLLLCQKDHQPLLIEMST